VNLLRTVSRGTTLADIEHLPRPSDEVADTGEQVREHRRSGSGSSEGDLAPLLGARRGARSDLNLGLARQVVSQPAGSISQEVVSGTIRRPPSFSATIRSLLTGKRDERDENYVRDHATRTLVKSRDVQGLRRQLNFPGINLKATSRNGNNPFHHIVDLKENKPWIAGNLAALLLRKLRNLSEEEKRTVLNQKNRKGLTPLEIATKAYQATKDKKYLAISQALYHCGARVEEGAVGEYIKSRPDYYLQKACNKAFDQFIEDADKLSGVMRRPVRTRA
jgi:hypothetical protein